MIIVMNASATLKEITAVISRLEDLGVTPTVSKTDEATIIGIVAGKKGFDLEQFAKAPGVASVVETQSPFKRVSREYHPQSTVIKCGPLVFGDGGFAVIAGPCAIESEPQIHDAAAHVKKLGATGLRGGAFKPRSSPYSFQGMGEQGLKFMQDAGKANNLATVSEVMNVRQIELLVRYVDVLQVGARNMQNFDLLKELGQAGKPVMLKRGLSATVEELLLAAEYIINSGNPAVILCERGIRTFETETRNTLDISAIPLCKGLSHLPIIVDPSHAAGRRDLIKPLTLAGIAVGADGAMIEVHPCPDKAFSDGKQSLTYDQFAQVMASVGPLVDATRGSRV